MMKYLICLCSLALLLGSCEKEAKISLEPLSDYYPLQVGKYITYDFDSTIFTQFGKERQTIHYQAKEVVEGTITDNLGRPGYRIVRYMRKTSGDDWVPNSVFMAVPTNNSIELLENNLRFVKLVMPIKQDLSWKGNVYLPAFPYPMYNDTGTDFMKDWDYMYDSVGVPLVINSITIDSTLKVAQVDIETGGDPAANPNQYADKSYSMEKYGKGIGLIYREFLHWEYQPISSSTSSGYTGFGIKMSITGHN